MKRLVCGEWNGRGFAGTCLANGDWLRDGCGVEAGDCSGRLGRWMVCLKEVPFHLCCSSSDELCCVESCRQ